MPARYDRRQATELPPKDGGRWFMSRIPSARSAERRLFPVVWWIHYYNPSGCMVALRLVIYGSVRCRLLDRQLPEASA